MSTTPEPANTNSPQPQQDEEPKHPIQECCDRLYDATKKEEPMVALQCFEELQSLDLEEAVDTPMFQTITRAWGRAMMAAAKVSDNDPEHLEELLADYEDRFGVSSPYLRAMLATATGVVDGLREVAASSGGHVAPEAVEALLDKYKPESGDEIRELVHLLNDFEIAIEGEISEKLQKVFVFRMRTEDPEVILKEMVDCGVKPTLPHAYNFIFSKPLLNLGKTAIDYYNEMLDNGIKPVASTFKILQRHATVTREEAAMFRRRAKGDTGVEDRYAQSFRRFQTDNNVEGATKLYKRMLLEGIHPDKYVFNTLIMTCRRNPEASEDWYQEMIKQDVQPNAVTFTNLITVWKDSRNVEMSERWIEEMKQRGMQLDVHNYAALMDAYVRGGQRAKAQQCFKVMLEKGDCGITAYNTAMKLGPFDFAFGCLACILSDSLQPTVHTRTTMQNLARDQISDEIVEELHACNWTKDAILRNDRLLRPQRGTIPSLEDCMRLMLRELKMDPERINQRSELLRLEIDEVNAGRR